MSSSAIDTALVTFLSGDATLTGLLPGGVFLDQAPEDVTAFVIVSLLSEQDVPVFGRRAFERGLYLVKAVVRSASVADVTPAGDRIDALLENAALTVSGFGPMCSYREERVRITEVDDQDPSVRWQHAGGHYRIELAVAA